MITRAALYGVLCLIALPTLAGARDLVMDDVVLDESSVLDRAFVLDESIDRFYQPQVYRLTNGMQVVLKPRTEVQKVSVRLAVNLGVGHFSCEQEELPHVIEHMVFEGTDQYSNAELERRVSERGASWNATTGDVQTTYTFEAYGPDIDFALATLYEIVSRSTMDEAAFARAIDSAQIESDNAPGFGRLLQRLDVGGYGSERMFFAMDYYCEPAIDAYQFSHGELMQAFARHYTPENMTMIVVGDFSPTHVQASLEQGFGRLPATNNGRAPTPLPWKKSLRSRYDSVGVAGFSNTSEVGIMWPGGGFRGDEYLPLKVFGHHLSTRLYNLLRNENQLSYSPGADIYAEEHQGVFLMMADTQRGDEEQVLGLLQQQVEQLLADGLGEQTFAQAKHSLLINLAMSDLDNAEIADYYSNSLFELHPDDQFWNTERQLQAMDYASFSAALQTFFRAQPGVEYIDRTFFDTPRVILLMGVFVLLSLFVLGLRLRRR
jgi:predicted Zn-dependent peptidase